MKQYNYFPGCTLKTTGTELERSTLKVSEKLGFQLVELPKWYCCGTMVALSSDNKMHSLGAVRTLIRVQETGDNRVVSLCSICYNTLKQINKRFNEDPDFKSAVVQFMDEETEYKGEVESLHYLQVLRDEIGFDKVKSAVVRPLEDLKIAPYYGCLLLRPKEMSIDENYENPSVLENLIESLGATPVDFAYKNECCGAYETVHNPEQVASMTYNIVEGARKAGADAIITSCPLCHFNLDNRQILVQQTYPNFQNMPILFFSQLMELALFDEKPVWEKHKISPDPIIDRFFQKE